MIGPVIKVPFSRPMAGEELRTLLFSTDIEAGRGGRGAGGGMPALRPTCVWEKLQGRVGFKVRVRVSLRCSTALLYPWSGSVIGPIIAFIFLGRQKLCNSLFQQRWGRGVGGGACGPTHLRAKIFAVYGCGRSWLWLRL